MINEHYTQVGDQQRLHRKLTYELSSEGRIKTKENS